MTAVETIAGRPDGRGVASIVRSLVSRPSGAIGLALLVDAQVSPDGATRHQEDLLVLRRGPAAGVGT